MNDDPLRGPRSLGSSQHPSPLPEPPRESYLLDWRDLWERLKALIGSGERLSDEIDASTQTTADDVLVGKVGIITAPTASGKAGEIRLPVRGGTQDYIACVMPGFHDRIEVNSAAEVISFMPPNTVYVKPSSGS